MLKNRRTPESFSNAFTLIELLVVVAIIAILAAIAVPNFLESQVRAKVSRVKSDLRSLAIAIESYRVDYNTYPLLRDYRPSLVFVTPGVSVDTDRLGNYFSMYNITNTRWDSYCDTLTTPIGYISKLPLDPFLAGNLKNPSSGSAERCSNFSYYFANIELAAKTYNTYTDAYQKSLSNPTDMTKKPAMYPVSPAPVHLVRDLVLSPDGRNYDINLAGDGPTYYTTYMMWSAGPEKNHLSLTKNGNGASFFGDYTCYRNYTTAASLSDSTQNWNARYVPPYDATNGTTSKGKIYRMSGGVQP